MSRSTVSRTKTTRCMKAVATYTAAAAMVLPVVIAPPAGAAAPAPIELASSVVDDLSSEGYLIVGGSGQSTDPTQWNYIPAFSGFAGTTEALPFNHSFGLQPSGGFTFTWNGVPIGVPQFMMLHSLWGRGLTADRQQARWEMAALPAQLCNYRIDFQNRMGNTIHSTWRGALRTGCRWNTGTMQQRNGPFAMRTGQMCARLFVNDVFRGEQCHNVFP